MKNKKILVLWPRYLSSQKLFFKALLAHDGVTLVFVGKWKENNSYNEKPDNYRELSSNRVIQWNFPEIRIRKVSLFHAFKMFLNILSIIKKQKFDLIITSTQYPLHSKYAYLISKIYNINIAIYTEAWIFKKNKKIVRILGSLLSNHMIVTSNYILTQSEHKCRIYQNFGIKKEKTIVLPFLIDDYQKNCWKTKQKEDNISILYLGRFIDLKGIDILLKAFLELCRKYNNINLLLGGGNLKDLLTCSPEVNEIYSQIISEGFEDKIKILGFLDESLKSKYLNIAHIFVMPTKTNEGWGITLMEAVQSACICIATDVVGAAFELIEQGENGFIVKANNYVDFKNAIQNCMELSPIQFVSFSKKSRNLFEKYNDVEKVSNVLNSL